MLNALPATSGAALIGLPETVDPQGTKSMGLQLLSLLVQQLKGRLEVSRTGGTRFTITFPRKQT